MLSDSPAKNITVSAMRRLSGIERVMIAVRRRRRRKKKRTSAAKRAPIRPLARRVLSDSRITWPWSKRVTNRMSCRRGTSSNRSISSRTRRATSRVLAWPSLKTTRATAGRELARTANFCSGGL